MKILLFNYVGSEHYIPDGGEDILGLAPVTDDRYNIDDLCRSPGGDKMIR